MRMRRLNKRVHVCASCGCRCSFREIAVENAAFDEVRAYLGPSGVCSPLVVQIAHLDQLVTTSPVGKHTVQYRNTVYHLHPLGVDMPAEGSDAQPSAQFCHTCWARLTAKEWREPK